MRRTHARRLVGLVAASLLLSAGWAQARQATVLRIEGPDVFVDLGSRDGLELERPLRVFKRVEATHPRSGKRVEGLFTLGELLILESGESLSRATADPEVLERLEVGDVVEVPARPPPPPRARPKQQSPPPPDAPATAHHLALQCPEPSQVVQPLDLGPLGEAWRRALTQGPRERAETWERFLSKNPYPELVPAIRAEIALLRREPVPARGNPVQKTPPPTVLAVTLPTRLVQGDPASVTVTTMEGAIPHVVLLHWRKAGSPGFKTERLANDKGAHHRGRLPPGAVEAPAVEYYVEAVDAGGRALEYGSALRPHQLEVLEPPGGPSPVTIDRSRVRMHYQFVDFNRFAGNDQYHVVEGDFLYRVLTPLHSLRVGFGTFRGWGSPRDRLDDPTYQPRQVGFSYGYAEFELRFHEYFGTLTRLVAGVSDLGLRGGMEAKVRIGREIGTSLVIGGAMTQDIGQRANLALAWDAVDGWPMSAEVIVTNEPIGRDLGVRLVYSVGRSVTDWLDLNLLLGYQLRDITHYGVSAGLGTTFHW